MRLLSSVAVLVVFAGNARAEGVEVAPSDAPQPAPAALPYNLWVDVPVTAGATALWLGTEALKETLAPDECRWCETNSFDDWVRDELLWDDIDAGDLASNITVVLAVPATAGVAVVAAGVDGAWAEIPVDLLLIAEATALAAAVNQVFKFSVGRERPFIHVMDARAKLAVDHPDDNNLSFYSGHTNLAFALLTASGTVATMRGYWLAPWIWTFGLPVAVATGYFRIAGDRHWFTDVLAGAVAGSAIGFGVPFFFHRPWAQRAPALAPVPVKGGGLVIATWAL